ncbi:hypothetical protein WA577_001577 [Blastocystis sp. JDR]
MKESHSFYFVRILLPLFMSCTGWNMVRRALGECAPHFIQRGFFTQSNYALMNTTAFIVYGLSKFITSHVVKGNLFRMYTLLFGMVGILCSLEGLASSSITGNYSVFFALWVVGYACMGTLWPILCIVFNQWLPDNLRGFYWSVICCCSSIGTILCNTLSRAVHGNPSSLFYALSIANLCNAFGSYSLYPSKRHEEVISSNHTFSLSVLCIA